MSCENKRSGSMSFACGGDCSKRRRDVWHESVSGRFHPVMADAPFAAIGVTEQARGGEEEPAPAPHPQGGLAAIDRAKHALDLIAMRVEIVQPVLRRALIMRAAPAPLLFDFEQIGILPDQVMARHHAAGEEMP